VPEYYKQAGVHLSVSEPASVDVLVVGAAATPGLVALPRNERNLLFAMARAGGASQSASGEVTLRRFADPATQTTVDLQSPAGLQAALELEPLASGDIVVVHAAEPNTIFVGGLVMAAGPQAYPAGSNITILQALAAAGGLRQDLFPHEGTLVRRMDGKDVHVKLNLDRLATGKDPNIALAAGDILWVPHTPDTRLHEFLQNTVYLRAGATVYYRGIHSTESSDLHGDEKERTSDTVVIGP